MPGNHGKCQYCDAEHINHYSGKIITHIVRFGVDLYVPVYNQSPDKKWNNRIQSNSGCQNNVEFFNAVSEIETRINIIDYKMCKYYGIGQVNQIYNKGIQKCLFIRLCKIDCITLKSEENKI
jgi:hypothetical protein